MYYGNSARLLIDSDNVTKRVLVVLGGDPPDIPRLRWVATVVDRVIAADGGANACIQAGLNPLVIGDLDSADLPPGTETIYDADQTTSDADKTFAHVKDHYPDHDVVVMGLEGSRLDHVMASISSLIQAKTSGMICLNESTAWPLYDTQERMWLGAEGTTFSVIPVPSALVTIQGGEWPLNQTLLELGKQVSLSNVASEYLKVKVHQGSALVIMERIFDPE